MLVATGLSKFNQSLREDYDALWKSLLAEFVSVLTELDLFVNDLDFLDIAYSGLRCDHMMGTPACYLCKSVKI